MTKMLFKYTHKTREGSRARIICEDYKGVYPVVAAIETQDTPPKEFIRTFEAATALGVYVSPSSGCILERFDPWDDVSIDTPVWVRHSSGEPWRTRHYAGKLEDGRIATFSEGRTSHTAKHRYSNSASKGLSYWSEATTTLPDDFDETLEA